jgi:hypothetical protein
MLFFDEFSDPDDGSRPALTFLFIASQLPNEGLCHLGAAGIFSAKTIAMAVR